MIQKYFFVTIDVEEDQWGSINIIKPSVENIDCLIEFQILCDKYNIIPTYLINYPVATNNSSRKVIDTLLDMGKCEIGMHCHPWNTPPNKENRNKFNSFLCNLSQNLVEEKIYTLNEVIEKNFAIKSTVFRAGRWGFGRQVLSVLEKFNYVIDTSITPFYSWEEKKGPNYKLISNNFYFLNQDNFDIASMNSKGKILEIPPTMGYLQKNQKMCNKVRTYLKKKPLATFKLNGILDILGIINYRWMSPESSTALEMKALAKKQFANGNNFINMFFHSNSLMPGLTPFVSTKRDLKEFYFRMENIFRFVVKNDIKSIPLSKGTEIC